MKAKIVENQVLYEFKKTYDKANGLTLFDESQAKYFKDVLVNPVVVGLIPHESAFKMIVLGTFDQYIDYRPL